jgi:hypothetical protein
VIEFVKRRGGFIHIHRFSREVEGQHNIVNVLSRIASSGGSHLYCSRVIINGDKLLLSEN